MVKKINGKLHEVILPSTDPNHRQYALQLLVYLDFQLWAYQRHISPLLELYINYTSPKGKSLEFINASHIVVWFNAVLQEELRRDRKHLLCCTQSWESQHRAQDSDRELLNQHFLFHLRPERNTFGRAKERGQEEEMCRKDEKGQRRGDGEKEEDGGRWKKEG